MSKRSIPFHVPDWARGIVWYQIMPERYDNGDPNNTPRAVDQKNAWPHDHTSPFERHPWGADWYKLQPYEQKNGRDIWFNLQRRRYGGDLQGIIDRLDYLQDLGIGALYLNPVFQAPSHHKYDAACYHHVDPNFGSDPDGDRAQIARETPNDPATWGWTTADELLLQLIEEVHRREMYIILDGVFNHMGLNSWIYQNILINRQKSPFQDWMEVESWSDGGQQSRLESKSNPDQQSSLLSQSKDEKMSQQGENPDTAFQNGLQVRTWEGFRELPELRQDRRGIAEGPRDYIFEITRRWMDPYGNGDPSNGVDGWRLDVAYCVKHPFWKAWRKHVRSINPDAFMVAEVIDTIPNTQPYLKGDEFDAVMNYNFKLACNEFFIRPDNRLRASEFTGRLMELWKAFPEQVSDVMQNLLGSHDTDRVASRIINRNLDLGRHWKEFFKRTKAAHGLYDTRKPTDGERSIQKLMILVQLTWPGAPMIYYGDESGMWGANDPCCRKPMIWQDVEYEPESVLPDGSAREEPDEVAFDEELHQLHRMLIHFRNALPALQYGDVEIVSTDDTTGVVVYRRRYHGEEVLVALHNGVGDVSVALATNLSSRSNDKLDVETCEPIIIGDAILEEAVSDKGAHHISEKSRRWIRLGAYSGMVIPLTTPSPHKQPDNVTGIEKQ